MLSENQEQQLPQLNQPQNSTFYVYNCYYPVVQDFMNQPPTLQIKNSSESFPQLMNKNESIQNWPQVPSFQFGGSTPFINPDDVLRQPQQNHFASFILNEQLKTQKQPSKNRIIEGTQMLCDVEIVIISRYFDIKANVFCPPNNKYTLKDDTSITNADWLKDRIQFRYKKSIKDSFLDMIDAISREDELTIKSMIKPLKFQQNGFDAIERQVPKSVKSEKPFSMFILEIQHLIAQFLFNKY